jgi:uncharacterized FlaG/YvyC family protein
LADDDNRGRIIGLLYLDLAKSLKFNETNKIIKDKSRIEKQETHLINDERHPLYSHKQEKIITFSAKVMELTENKEDLFFYISDNSNESIRTIKEFSTEEVLRFNKRVIEKINRLNKK